MKKEKRPWLWGTEYDEQEYEHDSEFCIVCGRPISESPDQCCSQLCRDHLAQAETDYNTLI